MKTSGRHLEEQNIADGTDAQPGCRQVYAGLWMGALAVLFWSFGSALIYFGAREIGTWRFVAIASSVAGLLQLLSRAISHKEIASAIFLPWRLWIGPLVCFVVYGLAWPSALATSNEVQVGGVNLINYLWPVLTVLMSIWLVPGVRLTRPVALAIALAMAGLLSANVSQLRHLFSSARGPTEGGLERWLPYALALLAALTWALYSVLLARWRRWAGSYVTSPTGFILIAIIAWGVLALSPNLRSPQSWKGVVLTVLYGAGPLAAGYLLWELALARAKIQTLSLLAAATPVLSTLILTCCLKTSPGSDLAAAAVLISGGVVLSRRN